MFQLHFGKLNGSWADACAHLGRGTQQLNWLLFGEVWWDSCGNIRFWVTHEQVK